MLANRFKLEALYIRTKCLLFDYTCEGDIQKQCIVLSCLVKETKYDFSVSCISRESTKVSVYYFSYPA